MAGSLSLCHNFWEIYILEKHPAKKQILSWLRHGVCIEEFLNKKSIGYFEGLHFCSTYPPKRIFNNHIPSKHEAWVEAEIYKAMKAGAIKEVPPDFPHVISPLQVHEKTDGKLRLCFDGRYINLFVNPPTFSNEGPQTIPNWGWKGMWMFSLDHKSGYYHVPLNQYSWKFFCFFFKGKYYCYMVLCFGWSPCAYIYTTIHESLANYVRSITFSPLKIYIDDSCGTGSVFTRQGTSPQQLKSTNLTLFVFCMVAFHAGFYLNLTKSILIPQTLIRYLGIMVDSQEEMFYIPEDRVDNLLALILKVENQNSVSIKQIETIVGKCRSMSLAVPAAILYTRAQYSLLTSLLQPKGHSTNKQRLHPLTLEYKEELLIWKKLRSALINGSKWYGTTHTYAHVSNSISHTDASSRRWAGILRTIDNVFQISEDFTEEELSRHINEKEALALFRFLFHLINFNPLLLRGKKILIHIDNQVLCFIYNNGGSSKQPYITAICKNLFWLQAHNKFHLEVEWIPTEQNLADAMTREDKINDIILTSHVFKSLWEKYGAFEMDLMASSANVQKDLQVVPLPFYSRYFSSAALGQDVFSHDIGKSPFSHDENIPLNYCFPPQGVLQLFINHLLYCKGKCVVIMPKEQGSVIWNAAQTGLKTYDILPSQKHDSAFLIFSQNKQVLFHSRFVMVAAYLDFSDRLVKCAVDIGY